MRRCYAARADFDPRPPPFFGFKWERARVYFLLHVLGEVADVPSPFVQGYLH